MTEKSIKKNTLRASLDLGTNTCILLLAELTQAADGTKSITRVLHDESIIVKLGQGVDQTGQLDESAILRCKIVLTRFSKVLEQYQINRAQVVAVATATARDASNGPAFFVEIKAEFGFDFKTISGREEAQASFLGGMMDGLDPKTVAIMDMGGGSTEFKSFSGEGVSLQMGSVRFSERFFKTDPVTDNEFWAAKKAVDDLYLDQALSWRKNSIQVQTLIGIGGSITSLAQWHLGLESFQADKIHGTVLTRGDLHRMVEELKWRTIAERAQIQCLDPKRADVILAGALIQWRALENLCFNEVIVSTRGLRYGILLQ